MMEYNIKDFLKDVEPRIMQRGIEYYHSDMVEELQKSGGAFTAKVRGSEYRPYQVDISFDEDGEVESWECSCPYDWGPVCKHVVAVLLAIERGGFEEQAAVPASQLEELVNQADAGVLRKLILGQCKKDSRFHLEVLSALSAPGGEELAAVKKLIKASIKNRCDSGYYNGCDYDAVCQDVRDSLEKARRRMEHNEYSQALDILQYLLTTCVELLHDSYDESDLPDTIAMILDLIGKCTSSMAGSASAEELSRQLDSILETADSGDCEEWDDYRYELLQYAAPLAGKQRVGKIYDLLDKWDTSQDSYYAGQNKTTRYLISSIVDGPETARAYLDRNLDVDELRIIAIHQDIEQENYANAERLCLEKLNAKREGTYYHPGQWNYLLYEIYEKWGDQEKRILQARQMVLFGDWSYYKIYKEAMLASGQWEAEYPKMREQIRTVRPGHEYMRLLSDEQEVDLLMEQVRLYPSTVFQYGAALAPRYGAEVYALCVDLVREGAETTANRKRYQELCHMIQLLHAFGGRKEALELIDELAQAYPRRRTMLEELNKTKAVCEQK